MTEISSDAAARDLVADRLIRQVKRFPDLELGALQTTGLDRRDGALARAIEHTVLRHWLTLQALIQSRLDRPWDTVQPELRGVLLTAAAQLFYLDRVPDHAAVNHAVNWTKGRGLARASGFVNGVLRALVRLRGNQEEPLPLRDDRLAFEPRELPLPNGAVRTLTEDVFHLDPLPRLAAQTSHSETLVAHWLSAFGEEATRRLCLHGLVHAPIIVNLEGAPELTDAAELEPHEAPGFAVFSGAHDRLLQLLDAHPSIRVQDPTSAHPVAMTADLAPGVIADVCAGLGTKTQQLAELHAESRIVASDVDERRLASLRERFQDDDRIVVAAPDELEPFYGACDLIVMDVPCSNTGVLPRRVEARYRFSRARTEQLVSMQRQIIADAIRLRSQMGRLLYATCSLEPAENTGQASWLENWHPFRREEESTTTPQGLPGDPPTRYRDGGYAAIFGSA